MTCLGRHPVASRRANEQSLNDDASPFGRRTAGPVRRLCPGSRYFLPRWRALRLYDFAIHAMMGPSGL